MLLKHTVVQYFGVMLDRVVSGAWGKLWEVM